MGMRLKILVKFNATNIRSHFDRAAKVTKRGDKN